MIRKLIGPFGHPDRSFLCYRYQAEDGEEGILEINSLSPPGTYCDNGESGYLGYRVNVYLKRRH